MNIIQKLDKLELVYSKVTGIPMEVDSFNGRKYFVTFIDSP